MRLELPRCALVRRTEDRRRSLDRRRSESRRRRLDRRRSESRRRRLDRRRRLGRRPVRRTLARRGRHDARRRQRRRGNRAGQCDVAHSGGGCGRTLRSGAIHLTAAGGGAQRIVRAGGRLGVARVRARRAVAIRRRRSTVCRVTTDGRTVGWAAGIRTLWGIEPRAGGARRLRRMSRRWITRRTLVALERRTVRRRPRARPGRWPGRGPGGWPGAWIARRPRSRPAAVSATAAVLAWHTVPGGRRGTVTRRGTVRVPVRR
jgi:hypothetical protein